ncbi:MAG: qor3 [Pseudonocardiales bacterium]|nr:qor3 [Pseudonocardiales bacterium]
MSDSSIRALVVTAPGDSSVLKIEPRTIGRPGSGELLITVAASGINFVEIYQREGKYPVPTPFVLGAEGAGWIAEVGPDIRGFEPGQLVAWAAGPGSHSDQLIIAADKVIPVPDGVAPDIAAAVPLQGMTAHYLLNSTYPVQAGDSVLVHAAAGGVGQLLVQLAKARGAHVIGTASTKEKIAKARALGADAMIRSADYPDPVDFAAAVRDANQGAGVTVAYDGVGQDAFEGTVRSVATRGMVVLFGAASGPVPPFDLQRLNPLGSLFVTRPTLADHLATREELLWRGGDIFAAVADGALQIEIGGRYPLEDAARAYDDLQSRRTTGKLLLTR